jgi:hypothetical protein
MVTWIKTVLILLIIYNTGFLIPYFSEKTPIRFWADFFRVRNVFGWIYGIVLFILSIPAVVIFYVFYWAMVLITWMDIFGTKKSYRATKFAQQIDEEDEE